MAKNKSPRSAPAEQPAPKKTRQTETLAEEYRALRGNVEKTLRKLRAPAAEPSGQAGGAAAEHSGGQASGAIRLASYNVHKCVGTDKQFDPQRIIAVIAELDADILALQEVDERFGERSGLLDLQELERQTGLRPAPVQSIGAQGQGWHGNALFHRCGAVSAVEQIALPGVEPRGALIADFQFSQGALRVVAAHFGLLRRSRAQQAEAILAALRNKPPMPTLLAGDLNEWRSGKSSSLRGLAPLFSAEAELPLSFPSRFPILPLDRVFFTPRNLVAELRAHDSPLARAASDHLPIQALIRLPQTSGEESESAD